VWQTLGQTLPVVIVVVLFWSFLERNIQVFWKGFFYNLEIFLCNLIFQALLKYQMFKITQDIGD